MADPEAGVPVGRAGPDHAIPRPASGRIAWLDMLRGAAVCGMVAFHLRWDLLYWGLLDDPAVAAAWAVFGHVVAACFLFVSGIGLSLARPRGFGFALRRLAVVGGAGLVVTVVTLRLFPAAPILFGILQCIAVTNAVALATLRLPAGARLLIAGAAVLAPVAMTSRQFDGLAGQWLGLAATLPETLDDRPVLPWLAVVLIGTIAGDALRRSGRTARAGDRPGWPALAWAGRHSLALYLAHQPLLFGGLMLATAVLGTPPAGPDAFARQCLADCTATGATPRLCATACGCVASRLAAEARSAAARLTPGHLGDVEDACRRGPD